MTVPMFTLLWLIKSVCDKISTSILVHERLRAVSKEIQQQKNTAYVMLTSSKKTDVSGFFQFDLLRQLPDNYF